jgi:hypothetical protein
MHELAPKFRYALKWLLRGAAGLGVIAAVSAMALPYLVEVRTVRDSLVKSLSQWSGGPVSIHGQLRMKSFASLSIEAEGVSFAATPRLSPIGRIEAKSVTAILKVPSLLSGRIEFKKVSVAAPRFVLARRAGPSTPDHNSSLETIGAAVAFAEQSRFDRLELQDCTFLTATGERRAYSRLSAGTITVVRSPGTSVFALYLRDQGLDASFHGTLSRTGNRAIGAIRLDVPRDHPAAERIAAAVAPWEKGHGISIAGDLTLAGGRLSLDGATIGFDGRGAKGSLTFATLRGRALTEGTLAYDTLEWIPAAQAGGTESASAINPLQALIPAVSGGENRADLDMRISAEHFRAGPYEAGPLALALTSRPDLVSIDIAELVIFGGRIAGRLDYDPRHPNTLSVNANGTRLDSEALANANAWPIAVSGPVNLRLALEIPFKDGLLAPELKGATGSFGIVFPAGGTLDGEVSKRLSEAFAHGKSPWELSSGSIPFTGASMDGAVTPGGVTLKLDSEAAANRIAGSLRIALPGGQIAGKLTVSPDDGAGNPAPASTGDSPNSSSIGLSGTVAALNFSVPRRRSLSN